jgi:hypothetical protein
MFKLEFGCVDGNKGSFIGTKEEIHRQIDNYQWQGIERYGSMENQILFMKHTKDIMKYGYSWQFEHKDYCEYSMTIDNGLGIDITALE